MSNIVDRIFNEVCLDERITDGIFQMENDTHMEALRDYFVKRGITKEDAISVTNRMLEGRFPDRQAYRKEDGILVTWPSPQHKKKAMRENPGKYTETDPKPKQHEPLEPKKKEPIKREPPEKEEPEKYEEPEEEEGEEGEEDRLPKSSAGSSLFDKGDGGEGEKKLAIEPPRGDEKPETPSAPAPSIQPPTPKTPEQAAAEKEVVKQIIKTDDNALANIDSPLNLNEKSETLKHQLNELYKKADELGFHEAVTFLTPYITP